MTVPGPPPKEGIMKPKSTTSNPGSVTAPDSAGHSLAGARNVFRLATAKDEVVFRYLYDQGTTAAEMVFSRVVDGGHAGDRCALKAEKPGPKPPLEMSGTITTDRTYRLSKMTHVPADYRSEIVVDYVATGGRRVPDGLKVTVEVLRIAPAGSDESRYAQPLSAFGVADAGDELAVLVDELVFATSTLEQA
jgi:hypothetical protein